MVIPRPYVLASFVLCLLPIGVTVLAYPWLPARVPTHFDAAGQPNDFCSPAAFVFGTAVMFGFLGALMLGLPYVGPMRSNFAKFRKAYGRISAALLLGFNGIAYAVLLFALGYHVRINMAIGLILGLMLATVGLWVGEVKRNFWIGFRTPWTLANDEVWERTNRHGGQILVVWGLCIAASSVFAEFMLAIGTIIVGAVVLVIWTLGYSATIYRRLGSVDQMH